MIKVQEKIGEKVYTNQMETKFPRPDRAVHLIVADVRGFLGQGGDRGDYRQIALGGVEVYAEAVRYWGGKPIKGLFEQSNERQAACLIQERIHFLGFVIESEYREGEIRDGGYYLPNERLLSAAEQTRVFQAYPLRPRGAPE